MIKIDDVVLEVGRFPDRTQSLRYLVTQGLKNIHWKYERDDELLTLIYIVNHMREHGVTEIVLKMPYIPNARMDRVKKERPEDVFTLKYFCSVINSLNFKQVLVADPHSDVSAGMIDRVNICAIEEVISGVVMSLVADLHSEYSSDVKPVVIYYPDLGCQKRYGDFLDYEHCYGNKKRDFVSGKIQVLEVISTLDLTGRDILMVDDICSYGGSFYYSAVELKKLGCRSVSAYATHVEDSIFNEEKGLLLKSGILRSIYTTDSLITIDDKRIFVEEI